MISQFFLTIFRAKMTSPWGAVLSFVLDSLCPGHSVANVSRRAWSSFSWFAHINRQCLGTGKNLWQIHLTSKRKHPRFPWYLYDIFIFKCLVWSNNPHVLYVLNHVYSIPVNFGWFFFTILDGQKGPYLWWSTPKALGNATEAWAAALQFLDLARASRRSRWVRGPYIGHLMWISDQCAKLFV